MDIKLQILCNGRKSLAKIAQFTKLGKVPQNFHLLWNQLRSMYINVVCVVLHNNFKLVHIGIHVVLIKLFVKLMYIHVSNNETYVLFPCSLAR